MDFLEESVMVSFDESGLALSSFEQIAQIYSINFVQFHHCLLRVSVYNAANSERKRDNMRIKSKRTFKQFLKDLHESEAMAFAMSRAGQRGDLAYIRRMEQRVLGK